MEVIGYKQEHAALWDELVATSPMATFLHTRRYLSYHGDRFDDASALIRDAEGNFIGVFPAAINKEDPLQVVSHPGITYGGMLHNGSLRGSKMADALTALTDFYRRLGMNSLRYKLVPNIYFASPSADDSYALFRLGASRYRTDLSSAIDLDNRGLVSERRRRGLKKAQKAGVEVAGGPDTIEPLWHVVTDNLSRKYSLRPVHSVEEISKLHSLFPENIEFIVAKLKSEVVAGIVLFVTSRVAHAQYTASTEAGQAVSALDAVFDVAIEKARAKGLRYFDFGISTENDGLKLNDGLYQYKSEFGGGGVVHEFYQLNLST